MLKGRNLLMHRKKLDDQNVAVIIVTVIVKSFVLEVCMNMFANIFNLICVLYVNC